MRLTSHSAFRLLLKTIVRPFRPYRVSPLHFSPFPFPFPFACRRPQRGRERRGKEGKVGGEKGGTDFNLADPNPLHPVTGKNRLQFFFGSGRLKLPLAEVLGAGEKELLLTGQFFSVRVLDRALTPPLKSSKKHHGNVVLF